VGFFDRSKDDPERVQARERIEAGGVPAAAERRLQELGKPGALFTSGLSVSEYSLLSRMGPRPLAQVMGASVVRPGLQLLPPLSAAVAIHSAQYGAPMVSSLNRITDATPSQVRNYKWRSAVVCELETLSDAWNTARRRAVDRLAEESLQVGADAVVGVHLHRGDHDLGSRTIEYVVNGTAIRLPGSGGATWPVLTDLSVQDLWRLHRAGYDAVGFLASSVVVFASAPRATRIRRARTTRQNQELTELTEAFHAARDTLRARLAGQVSDARGDGAVGVTFSHKIRREKFSLSSSLVTTDRRGWQQGRLGIPYYVSGRGDAERPGWMITMHAAGTAIRRREAAPIDVKPAIRMGAR
jgi:uncharacterized protein YbjQ (UPF0145 family)